MRRLRPCLGPFLPFSPLNITSHTLHKTTTNHTELPNATFSRIRRYVHGGIKRQRLIREKVAFGSSPAMWELRIISPHRLSPRPGWCLVGISVVGFSFALGVEGLGGTPPSVFGTPPTPMFSTSSRRSVGWSVPPTHYTELPHIIQKYDILYRTTTHYKNPPHITHNYHTPHRTPEPDLIPE